MIAKNWYFAAMLVLASIPSPGRAQGFEGMWNFDKSQSKDIGAFFESGEMRYRMQITNEGNDNLVIEDLTTTEAGWKRSKLNVNLKGAETASEYPRGDLAIFSFEAVAIGPDQTLKTKATDVTRSSFDLTEYFTVLVSQGTYNVVLRSHYALSADGKTLTVTQTRNSRKYDEPAVYVFHRAE